MDLLITPWPWYVSGPLIGLVVPLLLVLVGKPFGISSSFRHVCSICLPRTGIDYLQTDDWRGESWSLLFVVGIAAGAWIAAHGLSADPVELLPPHYAGSGGILRLLAGGVLVGFGTRYADGCTSGHSIMGLASLNPASLAATVSFFVGGLLLVHVLSPLGL